MSGALLIGVLTRETYVGHLSLEMSIGEMLGAVSQMYAANAVPFAVLATSLFFGLQLYRPLPGARVRQRIAHIAVACIAGSLCHLGSIVLFSGAPSRGVVVPAWGALCLAASSTRLLRIYFTSRFHLTPRTKAKGTRIEDVLVVGGAGYIGSVLTRQLLAAGYRVRILDLQLFGTESLNDIIAHSRLQVLRGDFRNVEDVVQAMRGVDAIVHLAAIVGDPACAVHEDATIAVNYGAAKMIAQLARAYGISRFVFASTCSVYGASDDTIDETSSLNPVSLYATTKIDAERALLDAVDDVFQPTILRLATAYGWSHRPRFDLVANLLSAKAVTDGEISIFNGEQWRPFVNTRDIARAIVMTLEAPLDRVGGEIFNVGDNTQNFTLRELGEIVAASVPGTRALHIRNDEDPRNYRVCFDKIQNVLGYRAEVSLEEGIREIVDAVRAQRITDWSNPIYSNLKQMEGDVLRVLANESVAEEAPNGELQATKQFLRRAA
ncbi:MAG: NAD-dependent epimerase/dehydratase family protein [Planctomycetes bacterium]|nr:NAD-dependent epimerase/dehydratase family protein [Planctomycetota bacterium]